MKVLIASQNAHKIAELTPILQETGFEVTDARGLQLVEPEEDGKTFIANARIKAEAAKAATGLVVLADDSGLVVEALSAEEEFPGVETAPYAKSLGGYDKAVVDIFDRLQDRPADCHYYSVLILSYPDGREIVATGRVDGVLRPGPKGEGTFGFDPWFEIKGNGKRFAELTTEEKNKLSHRGLALKDLLEKLKGLPKGPHELRAVS